MSRSTTPLDEMPGMPFVPSSTINYMISQGSSQGSAHSIASLTGPDKPYKPKFHKAVFYHNNATNANNNTSSISRGKDCKSNIPINQRHDEEISENSTISHALVKEELLFVKTNKQN